MERKNGQNGNKPSQNKRGIFGDLFGRGTPERNAGLAYSAMAIFCAILSLVFLVAIRSAGLTADENYASRDWYLYCSYLLTPIGFACAAALFFVGTKTPVKTVAAKCPWKYFLIAVLLQVGLWGLSELNEWFIFFLQRFGYAPSPIRLPSLDGFGLFGVLLVVAVLPALFEETLFRGILLGGLRSFGEVGAVLLCGALFALYHQNPVQTVYPFCCGAAFALVALRSGSILPTVLSHFINNATIILLNKAGIGTIPQPAKAIVLSVSALCLVASLVYLLFFDRKKGNGEKDGEERDGKADKKGFFLGAAAGIALFALSWILSLASGFPGA